MKEKEIRDRIEGFLQRTARNVVVPASMGIGLSVAGCNRHALNVKATDAAADLLVQADVTSTPDTTGSNDLPAILPPYMVAMPDSRAETSPIDGETDADPSRPDVATDGAPDSRPDGRLDAARDAGRDLGADMPAPPPPYLVPPPDAGRDLPQIVPPYLAPPAMAPANPGRLAPSPMAK